MPDAARPPMLLIEIRRALRGAVRLFLFDAEAYRYFTMTIGGFWRSFLAAFFAAPVTALTLLFTDRLLHESATGAQTIIPLALRFRAEALLYPIHWIIFPLVMVGLARLLGVTGRYVPYVVAYNWANVIAALIGLVPFVLYGARLLSVEATEGAIGVADLIVFVYLWFVARTGLGVSGITAAGLVMIDILLGYLIEGLMIKALGGF